jgi:putative ABC transport system permease protein
MGSFLQDLRFGFRATFRRPTFAIVASLTLALGLGVNIIMLSFAEALLAPPLLYKDPETLMMLYRETDTLPRSSNSFPSYFDWKERNRVFSSVAMFRPNDQNLVGPEGGPERITSLMVSAPFAETLGIEPYLGRLFTPDDDRLGAERTVAVSYELWQRRFGGDDALLGKSISISNELYTVIGILPQGLSSEAFGEVLLGDLWLPVHLFFHRLPVNERDNFDDVWSVARLRPDVSVEMARDDMARVARELGQEHPLTHAHSRAKVTPILDVLVGDLRPTVYVFLVTVGFVLLIACTNLVNLLLTRTAVRQQEIAMRTALGASRRRLARQVLTECLALAFLGGVLGLILAGFGIRALLATLPSIPYVAHANLSLGVLGITAILCVLVALAIGVVPAFQNIRTSFVHLLGAPMLPLHRRWRQSLVIIELALATALLIAAGLVIGSFRGLQNAQLGFSPQGTLVLKTALPEAKYGEAAVWTSFFDETLRRLGEVPGIEQVAMSAVLPLTHAEGGIGVPVLAGDRPIPAVPEMARANFHTVSSNFFDLMGIPLLQGRTFTSADDDRRDSRRVLIVTAMLARHFWGDRSPIGERICFEFIGNSEEFDPQWREIVGVVGDVRDRNLVLPPQHSVYVPYTQLAIWSNGFVPEMTMLIKSRVESASVVKAVRTELSEIDPNQPLYGVQPFVDVISKHLDQPRMVSTLLSGFAVLGFILAVVGVYGVISYMVVAQMRDIGLRMAVGASPLQILFGVLREGLVMIGLGIGLGLVLAWNLTYLMSSQLPGIETKNPWVFAVVAVALATIAFLANLIPAVQAMRMHPSEILRWE